MTPNSKGSPTTPRILNLIWGVSRCKTNSPSPLQSSRLYVDNFPKFVTSKPSVNQLKIDTVPDVNLG